MKRALIGIIFLGLMASLVGCGGGDKSAPQTTSQLANRAFITNSFYGATVIADASQDKISAFSINTGALSRRIFPTADKKFFGVFAEAVVALVVVKVEDETINSVVSLPDFSESIAIKTDASTAYAAVKNAPGDNNVAGAIQVIDLPNQKITSTISIPAVRWISMNGAATKILAFSDQLDTVNLIDLTKTPIEVTAVAGTFSRPINAYWSSDDTKAYIINCGVECGAPALPSNSRASVTELTVASGALRSIALPNGGASTALLDGTTLYVAGTPNGLGPGTINTIDVAAMATTGAQVTIGPAFHRAIAKANNRIWVGATGCGSADGCLTMFNPSDRTALVDTPTGTNTTKGDVTGLTAISGRSVIYVVEGSQLRTYDATTGAESTPFSLDIKGAVWDVIAVP